MILNHFIFVLHYPKITIQLRAAIHESSYSILMIMSFNCNLLDTVTYCSPSPQCSIIILFLQHICHIALFIEWRNKFEFEFEYFLAKMHPNPHLSNYFYFFCQFWMSIQYLNVWNQISFKSFQEAFNELFQHTILPKGILHPIYKFSCTFCSKTARKFHVLGHPSIIYLERVISPLCVKCTKEIRMN